MFLGLIFCQKSIKLPSKEIFLHKKHKVLRIYMASIIHKVSEGGN